VSREIRRTTTRSSGGELALYEWPGSEPAVLLCHATSFHAQCWNAIVERLPGQRVLALDFRGHGASAKPEPPCPWRPFAEDVEAAIRHFRLTGALGVGHSMGGHSVALAAARQPGAFAALLLLDPTIVPEDRYRGATESFDFVLRRRNRWNSPQEMFERLVTRIPFQRWDPAILLDYCQYGLAPDGQLACPPAVEASIYANGYAPESNIYPDIRHISIPVKVVRGPGEFGVGKFDGSPTAPDLASRFLKGEDLHLTGVSHFFPMEAPDLTARLIAEFARPHPA
jgi:pimeloyl-ACP methyl ester carboxylesterase